MLLPGTIALVVTMMMTTMYRAGSASASTPQPQEVHVAHSTEWYYETNVNRWREEERTPLDHTIFAERGLEIIEDATKSGFDDVVSHK
jgi:hypothetical protein